MKREQWKQPWPWGATAAAVALMAVALRLEGRLWRSADGRVLVWAGEAWGSDTSQHLFDPYSFTHLLHGVIFCGLLALAVPRAAPVWRLFLGVVLEAAWEVVENSSFIIDRYREGTAARGYEGDTVVNSLGDIAACALGLVLAWRLGWRRSLGLVVLIEVVLLVLIRDSLLLNIVMLIHPVEWIMEWQAAAR